MLGSELYKYTVHLDIMLVHMGQATKMGLSYYLVLLSFDSKIS